LIPQEMARSQPDEPGDFHGRSQIQTRCRSQPIARRDARWLAASHLCSESRAKIWCGDPNWLQRRGVV